MKGLFFLFCCVLTVSLSAQVVEIDNENGISLTIDVDNCESLLEVSEKISALVPDIQDSQSIILALSLPSQEISKISFWDIFTASKKLGGYLGYPRDYFHQINESEKKQIQFIFNTLGFRSLSTIMRQKSNLNEAGNYIDHIHPFRLLLCVLTDEKMQKAFRNMRGRGWIWGDFMGGMKSSLFTEAEHDNLKLEFIYDFSQQLNLDVALVTSYVQSKNWDKFIDTLISNIPRNENEDRYDN